MKEKRVLILGGSSDIGQAIIRAMRSDYIIHYTYFNSGLDRRSNVSDVISHYCDIRESTQVVDLFREVGRIDALVTAAFPFLESDNFDFFEGYLANERFLRGHVLAICEASKVMTKGGKIVNLLGQCVEKGLAGGAYYSASYAFIHNLSMSINSKEGREGKISSHDIMLGPVNTSMWSSLSDEQLQKYKEKVSDFISPDQVANEVRHIIESEVGPTKLKLDAFYSL